MTLRIRDALARARERGVDRLDAQLLLASLLQRPRSWLIAHDDAALDAQQASRFGEWLDRRAAGEPLAYLLGEKEFHGLALHVTPDVLVPRPDTETLVDWALALLAGPLAGGGGSRVVDLGTGSGAIALAIKHGAPQSQVSAVDRSPAALAVARANGKRLQLEVEWQLGDWWTPLDGRRFHLAVSNPPYVADGDAHLAALLHEPRPALASGPDGLDALRHIIAHAPRHLEPGGWLLLEHGHDQAAAVHALLAEAGFGEVQSRRDLAGIARCTGGRLPWGG
ncbi:MAG TPA: peptide chain release factor N(5)-glutamine methyltransferase [Albitalea sp.]